MLSVTSAFLDMMVLQCTDMLDREDLVKSLNDSNFDLTLSHFFNFCPNGLSRLLKIPKFIWVAPGTFFVDHVSQVLGLPNLLSYIPYYTADCSDRMSFTSRVKNVLWSALNYIMSESPWLSVYKHETEVFQRFPNEDFPNLWTVAKEDSQALLINGEDFLDFPRPSYHGMLHMGNLE
jgi:hypothetical protein